jgi:omega-hydroxy-beta-dihydromenaquinone-9 sulfotransferase
MYFNFELFGRAQYLTLFKTPFSGRRWAYVLFFTLLYGVMWLIVAAGRALDHLFFPGFKSQPVHAPVFIVAPPRSGTSLIQKLLSLDRTRFVHNTLAQTIFPAVSYQRLFNGLGRLDRVMGRPVQRVVGWAEKKWFGGWDDLHKMRFNQPEEDHGFFVYTFVTEAIFLLFLHVDELWEAGFQDALSPEHRRKLMAYYRSCLQRRLHASGPDKSILSKCTQSCGSVESLLEAFPDARFITIVRHPYESVPSHVSVFWPVWRKHSPTLQKDGPQSRAYANLAVQWFRHLFEFRRKVPPRRYYCLNYRDLVSNPKAAIEGIYQHFGWPITQAFRAELARATEQQRTFKSKHRYTLEEFGLSREWIQAELGEMMDHYALPR